MPTISPAQPELSVAGELPIDSAGKPKLRRRRRKRKKKIITEEQILASRFVHEWAFGHSEPCDDCTGRVLIELHSHSKFSDGFLSPAAVVERAHRNGVRVLALTDHDTMAGIPGAKEAAQNFKMRIIPGVEISSLHSPGDEAGEEEPVHILAYYSSYGPSMCEELDDLLANIRDGRYIRAQEMLVKLDGLKMPLKWEDIVSIAGKGVAPGRVHVARAMVEAGYVDNLKQAFNKYLYDGGPAYAKGSVPLATYVVQLVCSSGGVVALAHPWALKNPVAVIKSLKDAGLHAMEVYRSDGKIAGFSNLADTYDLIKLGGSDYHGRKDDNESDLGSVHLPVVDVFKFLKLARPIWHEAARSLFKSYVEEPSSANMKKIWGLNKPDSFECYFARECFDLCSISWLSEEERQIAEVEKIRIKFSDTVVSKVEVHLQF